MNFKSICILIPCLFVLSNGNQAAIDGPKSIIWIDQNLVDTTSQVMVYCTDGSKYMYSYPDAENPANSELGARSFLSILYRAKQENAPIYFFYEGTSGDFKKANQVRLETSSNP